jgi:hypothetical protein
MKNRASVVLLDLVSAPEVEQNRPTECDVVMSMLHNGGTGVEFELRKVVTRKSFRRLGRGSSYDRAEIVHLSGHAHPKGLRFIGKINRWDDLGKMLTGLVPRLRKRKKQRILMLSTCFARRGLRVLKPLLRRHFTGIYYFQEGMVDAEVALTVWCMFYGNACGRPKRDKKVLRRINAFYGRKTLVYLKL